MHLLCLGISKYLLQEFLHGDRHHRIGLHNVTFLQNLFNSISHDIPMEFQRKTFDLLDIINWKATQFRFFLLYYSLFLSNVLPHDTYRHFMLLYVSCRLLSSERLALQISVKELKRGRKSVGYDNESSRSSKWRRINDIRQIYSHAEIQHAFITSLRSNGNSQLANKINKLLSPDIDEIYEEPIEDNKEYDEVLALIQDTKLTKYQYEILHSYALSKNVYIFHSYKKLFETKILCYPSQ